MSERQKLAERLQRARRELDTITEDIDRLARVLAEPAGESLDLVGATEIGAMAGVGANVVGTWVSRGKLPEPVAVLAMGRVWLKSDIKAWLKAQPKTKATTNGRRK